MTQETNKLEKPLDILIVEDQERHIEDAIAIFQPIAERGFINYQIVTTLNEARQELEKKYDGIISDVFFPTGLPEAETLKLSGELFDKLLVPLKNAPLFTEYFGASQPWRMGNDSGPVGVLVAEQAVENNIPIALITDTYHHGKKSEPVNNWRTKFDPWIPLIDNYEGEEGKAKNWRAAYGTIACTIENHGLMSQSIGEKLAHKDKKEAIEKLERAIVIAQTEGVSEALCKEADIHPAMLRCPEKWVPTVNRLIEGNKELYALQQKYGLD